MLQLQLWVDSLVTTFAVASLRWHTSLHHGQVLYLTQQCSLMRCWSLQDQVFSFCCLMLGAHGCMSREPQAYRPSEARQ